MIKTLKLRIVLNVGVLTASLALGGCLLTKDVSDIVDAINQQQIESSLGPIELESGGEPASTENRDEKIMNIHAWLDSSAAGPATKAPIWARLGLLYLESGNAALAKMAFDHAESTVQAAVAQRSGYALPGTLDAVIKTSEARIWWAKNATKAWDATLIDEAKTHIAQVDAVVADQDAADTDAADTLMWLREWALRMDITRLEALRAGTPAAAQTAITDSGERLKGFLALWSANDLNSNATAIRRATQVTSDGSPRRACDKPNLNDQERSDIQLGLGSFITENHFRFAAYVFCDVERYLAANEAHIFGQSGVAGLVPDLPEHTWVTCQREAGLSPKYLCTTP